MTQEDWERWRQERAERRVERKFTVHGPPASVAVRQYSREDCVEALRAWLADGGSGYVGDWTAAGMSPSASTIEKLYGWATLINEAGGRSRGNTKQRKDRRSREECLDAVVRFLLDDTVPYGGCDKYTAWALPRGLPGGQTVRTRFGTWSAAKQAAIDVINSDGRVKQ